MKEAYRQYRDKDGVPVGGMVFRAPDQETLAAAIAATVDDLPQGWKAEPVASARLIITPDIVKRKP